MASLASFHKLRDFGLLFMRLVIAFIFVYHGVMKWGLWENGSAGMPGALGVIFQILSVAEPLGAAALILGITTEAAAIGLGIDMIGAIIVKITVWHVSFIELANTGWEFDLMILAGLIVLITNGAGKFSFDYHRRKLIQ